MPLGGVINLETIKCFNDTLIVSPFSIRYDVEAAASHKQVHLHTKRSYFLFFFLFFSVRQFPRRQLILFKLSVMEKLLDSILHTPNSPNQCKMTGRKHKGALHTKRLQAKI